MNNTTRYMNIVSLKVCNSVADAAILLKATLLGRSLAVRAFLVKNLDIVQYNLSASRAGGNNVALNKTKYIYFSKS